MKNVRPVLIALALVMAGCADTSSDQAVVEQTSGGWSWSSLAPWNWFGHSIEISESGVGTINRATPMTTDAIQQALGGDYTLRKGMRSEKGQVIAFFQAMKDNRVMIEISGGKYVSQVIVMDSAITTDQGAKIDLPFSKLYEEAFGSCVKNNERNLDGVLCQAMDSHHISYLFNGKWNGPESIMPPDDILQNWTISKLIWKN
ncbi:MAG: putative protein YfeY [Candidatus Erwinia impunctatus]|nr:putative protein YfeY [Culicoides impunctatus]